MLIIVVEAELLEKHATIHKRRRQLRKESTGELPEMSLQLSVSVTSDTGSELSTSTNLTDSDSTAQNSPRAFRINSPLQSSNSSVQAPNSPLLTPRSPRTYVDFNTKFTYKELSAKDKPKDCDAQNLEVWKFCCYFPILIFCLEILE